MLLTTTIKSNRKLKHGVPFVVLAVKTLQIHRRSNLMAEKKQ